MVPSRLPAVAGCGYTSPLLCLALLPRPLKVILVIALTCLHGIQIYSILNSWHFDSRPKIHAGAWIAGVGNGTLPLPSHNIILARPARNTRCTCKDIAPVKTEGDCQYNLSFPPEATDEKPMSRVH